MVYTIKISDLSDNSLQHMIDWCICGIEFGHSGFKNNFLMLLDEKLKRQEIYE